MTKLVTFVGLLACGLILLGITRAPLDPIYYGGMHWRLIGPSTGGRVTAVAGVPSQPYTYYMGAAGGGVWKTSDDGATWDPIFDKEPVASIGAIAVAPSDPNVLYIGTGEADLRDSVVSGNGMYKSIDAGKTWTYIGLTDTRQIGRIVIDPHDSHIVYVAALGHPFGPNSERGVFRTIDGGATWKKMLYKNADTGAIDIAMDPQNSHVLYAALWQTRRPPWSVYPPSNGPGSGLYKTEDGGASWHQLTTGIPTRGLGRISLAIAPSNPDTIYAVIDATNGGLYRSDDAGAHWRLINGNAVLRERSWYYGNIAVDPVNPDGVWVAAVSIVRSTNGGKELQPVSVHGLGSYIATDFHSIWIDTKNPSRMIVGSDKGGNISIDGGVTWSSNNNQPLGQYYRISVDNRSPYWVYGAQQDEQTWALPSRTNRGAIENSDIVQIGGSESGYTAPDPDDPQTVAYTSGSQGCFITVSHRKSQDSDAFTSVLLYPEMHRCSWTQPVVFSKRKPAVLYYAEERLFRSADKGYTWSAISPDLTRKNPPASANLDPITAKDLYGSERQSLIFTIAPSPLRDGEIWAGTDDGKIWITHDEGKHWTDVTPPQLTPWSKVTLIEASSHDPQTAYAAVDRHFLDDYRPYLYKTHDGGRTWRLAVAGIPGDAFLNGVREDPVRAGLLYAATQSAVYVSFDDGNFWNSLQLNMPTVPIHDIAVHGNDLIAGTFGRSWWILDDLSPLRQLTAIRNSPAWLFAPLPAQRSLDAQFTHSILRSPGVVNGENPPSGGIFDYYLGRDVHGVVALEIRDASGGLVRSYSSAQKDALLSSEPGMHRFTWNFTYAPTTCVSSGIVCYPTPNGLLAPPGKYRVRLLAGGSVYAQTFVLEKGSHVTAKHADFLAQYREARRIQDVLHRIDALCARAQSLQEHLVKNTKEGTAAQRARAKILLSELTNLIGGFPASTPDDAWGPPVTNVRSFWNVYGQLHLIQGFIEQRDAAPSNTLLAAAERYQEMVNPLAARLDTIARRASTAL